MKITYYNKLAQDSHITNEETMGDIEIDVADSFFYDSNEIDGEIVICLKDQYEQTVAIKMGKDTLQEIFYFIFEKHVRKVSLHKKKRRILI